MPWKRTSANRVPCAKRKAIRFALGSPLHYNVPRSFGVTEKLSSFLFLAHFYCLFLSFPFWPVVGALV